MKLLKRILLIIAGIALMGFFYFEPIAACIAVILLTVQLIDYRNIILLPNPFDRKIDASKKRSHYYLYQLFSEIKLQNYATNDDLFIAFSEYIYRQSDNYIPSSINISSSGTTCVHSEDAFFPFRVENSTLSFRNLIPGPYYPDRFFCGSVPCRGIEIPKHTKYLSLEYRCHAESISIPCDTIPVLETEHSKVYVPENFSVKVPPELNESALSDSSWSEVQFIGPSGETIDPFRNIRGGGVTA